MGDAEVDGTASQTPGLIVEKFLPERGAQSFGLVHLARDRFDKRCLPIEAQNFALDR